jgi:hypothetical protein
MAFVMAAPGYFHSGKADAAVPKTSQCSTILRRNNQPLLSGRKGLLIEW